MKMPKKEREKYDIDESKGRLVIEITKDNRPICTETTSVEAGRKMLMELLTNAANACEVTPRELCSAICDSLEENEEIKRMFEVF